MFKAEEIVEIKGLRSKSVCSSKRREEINCVTGNWWARSRVAVDELEGWAEATPHWAFPALIRIMGSILRATGSY